MAVLWLAALLVVVIRLIVDDVRHRHLANPLVAVFTGLAVVAAVGELFGTDRLQPPWLAIGAGVVALLVGLAIHPSGLIAGGDVKLLFGIVAVVTRLGSDGWLVYLGLLIPVGLATALWYWRAPAEARAAGIPLAPMLLAGVPPSALIAGGL